MVGKTQFSDVGATLAKCSCANVVVGVVVATMPTLCQRSCANGDHADIGDVATSCYLG